MPIKTFEQELEEARAAEEKFTPVEAPPEEEPTKDETTPDEITVEMWQRQQATIKDLVQRSIAAESAVRRYRAKYGPLED